MNRREWGRILLATLALAAGPLRSWPQTPPPLRVNGSRVVAHLRALAKFGRNPEGGISRVAYSEADRQAREYVLTLMREAQLQTSVDAAGNIVGRRAGSDPTLPPVLLGSHIDSVPQGGNYDGQVGSMGAIEVAQTLVENGFTLRHPLEVVIFSNEEGGKTGSRAMSGELTEKEFDLVTHSGKSIREGMEFLGGDTAGLARMRRKRGEIAAYLELHIEQGGILENQEIDIGIVEGIVGIKRWRVRIDGFANHAGTTPMNSRRDALLAAARFVEAVNQIVRAVPGRQVGTVGQIQVQPGAPNVIAGQATVTLELRDLDMTKVEMLYRRIEARGQEIAQDTGTRFSFVEFYLSRAAPTDKRLRHLIADAARELGFTTLRMPSGAGHDAQSIARLAPVGMIFIPSRGGISHSPREFSRPENIIAGTNVLLHTLLKVDRVSLLRRMNFPE